MNVHTTAFQHYGGMVKVSRIVIAFYDKVVETPELAPYFEGSDMRSLIEHQSHFLASVMGGPHSFTDEELRAFHAGRRIDSRAFDLMMGLLRDTLREFAIADEHAEEIMGELEKRRAAIVS